MPLFQLEVPDKFVTQLATEGRSAFLTALVLHGERKLIEVTIVVLHSKEFVYTATRIEDAPDNEQDPRPIPLPWIET